MSMTEYNVDNSNIKEEEDVFTPFSELCKFADRYHLTIELEKPFDDSVELVLSITTQRGKQLNLALEDIDQLNDRASSVLNRLSKNVKES